MPFPKEVCLSILGTPILKVYRDASLFPARGCFLPQAGSSEVKG